MATIEVRKKVVINTDPQRRCYNGCHFKSEVIWSSWEPLELGVQESRVEERLAFWRDLNDYAVGERGESARCQYRNVTGKEKEDE